ncbi:MAG: FtsW/RodA/SpoVE family cell cycle protein [Candidatus Symbiothrix sp.]|jgi:cell division protein FtsW (lipid II flippase)/cell division protein FtsI/penicillin-binding protein 2|nr:FtsW/RodA/SpoVE family cell cycle protein [Candidatus Symbiothrix sp.]
MQPKETYNKNHRTECIALLLVTVIIALAFFRLYSNQKENLAIVNQGIEDKTVFVLKKGVDSNGLSKLLVDNNYFSDKKDADAIANSIHDKLEQGKVLPNLGALNLSGFRIDADSAELIGGEALTMQVQRSREILQLTSKIDSLYTNLPSGTIDLNHRDSCSITVKVHEKRAKASWFAKLRKKDFNNVDSVIVQLKEHYWLIENSYQKSDGTVDTIFVAKDTICGYATTNQKGIAIFQGLKKEGHYSVLPIKKGFEYGSSQGTNNGKPLKENQTYSFSQKAHTIHLIDRLTYSQIKEDATIIVRTPQDYKDSLLKYIVLFFLAWWSLYFYLQLRKKETDPLILPLLMTLTGICLVVMYAIHDPLVDKMLGEEMAHGIISGVMLIAALSEVNFLRFVNSQSGFKINNKRMTVPFDLPFLPEGYGYLLLALLLALLLIPFGTGPEGSDVQVNLFFFQPSEITKYLMVIFLATFFSKNATYFLKITDVKKRIRNIAIIGGAIAVLLGIYLFLGDMGPALVLALTFILIYSVARRDFPQLLLGTASFALMLWLSVKLGNQWRYNSQLVLASSALLWFVVWLGYGRINKKQIFESALFLNLVIAAFIFGGNLPKVGERLNNRNAIYANLWDNDVTGGDQVAQGLWGLAYGGTFGQGLGEGNPNLVPAFHTDMIFTGIGEELGWTGLLIIILCLAVLLHRSLLIGRRAAQPLLFYLATGIAIVTGVQFLIITFGSIGIIPLTGVAVPFLSYGKVGIILNLAAFGVVLSISKNRGSNLQKEEITKNYDMIIGAGSLAYTLCSMVLLSVLASYQFFRQDTILVKPAFIVTQQGERMVEYNPRISLLMRELNAGIIYDRNGMILATNKDKKRYYPFGNSMLFWTGDFNSKILWEGGESARGYIAEYRHLDHLRGFDNEPQKVNLPTQLTGNRFLTKKLIRKDFYFYHYPKVIVDILKDGLHGKKVREQNAKRELNDISLTVDAALQMGLQEFIKNKASNTDPEQKYRFHEQSRVSVVVLGAETGELLASANYPLPDPVLLKALSDNKQTQSTTLMTDRDLGITEPTAPGSTAKVMSALASFIKLGNAADTIKYYVDPAEIIHADHGEEPKGRKVGLSDAIVNSSNVYFIKLVNDKNLVAPLADIYWQTGVRVNFDLPYVYYKNLNEKDKTDFKDQMEDLSIKGTTKYRKYVAERKPAKLHDSEYQLAWGQSPISATPLTMARVVATVANGGILKDTKFVITNHIEDVPKQNETQIVDKNFADTLKSYMKIESKVRKYSKTNPIYFTENVGGKSGTPQIAVRTNHTTDYDGWYIFFVENTKEYNTIAVAVRIENVKSGTAAQLAADLVKKFWTQAQENN